MGTRHHQTVIDKKGRLKISQYGQWDGYPTGQGKDILEFLKTFDKRRYQSNLEKIKFLTKQQVEFIESEDQWDKMWPHLSRDCGSKIHQMIEAGSVKYVMNAKDCEKWCEGFYEINFKANTFKTEYRGVTQVYGLDSLPTIEQYIEDMTNETE